MDDGLIDASDDIMARLRHLPVDGRLAGIAPAVMTGLARRRDRAAARRSMALAAALALGVGIAGGALPAAPARAVPTQTSAIGLSDYAPSRLLGG